MIRFSALLTVAAMAMLVAGVFSASLGLIYASIAVSILAALTLGAGVLLRRRELFGVATTEDVRPGWAAADAAGTRSVEGRPARTRAAATGSAVGQPSGAGQVADDRPRAGRGDSGGGGEKDGDLAEGPQEAASGTGSALWPGSIAAKGGSAAGRRGGEHSAAHAAGRGRAGRPASGTGSSARDPAARTPAPREPAPVDRARMDRDRGGRAPGDREPAGRPWGDREPARDEPAARDRERAAAKREPAAWGDLRAAPGRDQEAATPRAQRFRLPSADERAARARDDAARRGHAASPAAGDDFWERVGEELPGSGSQGPARPAWPSTAGPRAMGAGAAIRHGSAETGDDEQAGRPAAGEPGWERMVPPYVDDLTRPRRDREPAGSGSGDVPARDDSPAPEEAEAAAGQEAGGAWSAWSSFRVTRAGAHGGQLDEDEQRREPVGRAESELTGRVVPDGGPAAGEPAESASSAGDVTGGDAGAGDETSKNESAAAADVAGDERDGAEAAEPPAARDGAPDAALAGTAAGTDEAGEAAQSDAETGDPGDRQAGGADLAGQEDGAERDTAKADGAVEVGDTGRAAVTSSGGRPDDIGADDRAADTGGTPVHDEVTIVPGVGRYHRRGCILIRFLGDGDLETATRGEAEAAGLVPCKACQPDKPDPSA